MIVRHNHNCMMCNRQRTCFTFSEFSILFAICKECYDQLDADAELYSIKEESCSFCENHRKCRNIDGFDDALFFGDLLMCDDCLEKIRHLVE